MNKIPIILATLAIASIFVSSSIPDSEAKLWDFVVDIEFLESPINEGKNPILIGTVVDHAYRPLSNIDVKLTVAGESHMLKTDGNGEFGKQIDVSDYKILLSSREFKKTRVEYFVEQEFEIEKTITA